MLKLILSHVFCEAVSAVSCGGETGAFSNIIVGFGPAHYGTKFKMGTIASSNVFDAKTWLHDFGQDDEYLRFGTYGYEMYCRPRFAEQVINRTVYATLGSCGVDYIHLYPEKMVAYNLDTKAVRLFGNFPTLVRDPKRCPALQLGALQYSSLTRKFYVNAVTPSCPAEADEHPVFFEIDPATGNATVLQTLHYGDVVQSTAIDTHRQWWFILVHSYFVGTYLSWFDLTEESPYKWRGARPMAGYGPYLSPIRYDPVSKVLLGFKAGRYGAFHCTFNTTEGGPNNCNFTVVGSFSNQRPDSLVDLAFDTNTRVVTILSAGCYDINNMSRPDPGCTFQTNTVAQYKIPPIGSAADEVIQSSFCEARCTDDNDGSLKWSALTYIRGTDCEQLTSIIV